MRPESKLLESGDEPEVARGGTVAAVASSPGRAGTVASAGASRLQVVDRPKVLVVTPSLDQARYLRQTIESVLFQDYPHIDYFVADGGSSDGSVEILRSFGTRLRWVSTPDEGQSAAIAAAWSRSDAPLVAWLNSDDTYEPGAVSSMASHLEKHPEHAVAYGRGWWVDGAGRKIKRYPTRPFDAEELFHDCFVCQPATLLRRSVFETSDLPDPRLRYCMDYDLWIRLARRFRFGYLDRHLANARLHAESKTVREIGALYREVVEMSTAHFGLASRNWSVVQVLDRCRQRAERLRLLPPRYRRWIERTLVRRAEARLIGPLYADGWAGSRTVLVVPPASRIRVRGERPFWPHRSPLRVRVLLGGHLLARLTVREPRFTLDVAVPEGLVPPKVDALSLVLCADKTFVPQQIGVSSDPRPVSFLVRAVDPPELPRVAVLESVGA